MRRALTLAIAAFLILGFSVSHAGAAVKPGAAVAKPLVRPLVLAAADGPGAKTVPAKLQTDPEITQVRWFHHNEVNGSAAKLRIVLDVTAPVVAQGVLNDSPCPRLIVTVKGAAPGKAEGSLELDGKIADSATIEAGPEDGTSRVVIDLVALPDADGFRVFTLPGNPAYNKPFRVVIDINQVPLLIPAYTPGLRGKVIVLDPGHGGSDPGAIGPGGTQEKTVTLAVSQRVRALLEKAGAKVIMTRTDDRDVYPQPGASDRDELQARVNVANSRKADLFLSIHANAFNNRNIGGTTVYYYQKTQYDLLLAQTLSASLVPAIGLVDRGVKPANFYVVRRTLMPAALIELAYISNPTEEKLLMSPQFQEKSAQAIVAGLDNFFAAASLKKGGGR